MIVKGNRVQVLDEGVLQGFAGALNFTGAGVTAAVAANVATVTISGGGGGGGLTYTNFTANLGRSLRSGTFDITGLSGLTVGKVVNMVQTMAQVASRGNAIDEFELDPITLTAYVLSATAIRALWACSGGKHVAVGTYAFAYQVSA